MVILVMGKENYYCIIMAGGVGSRFWPVSRNDKPKQFLDFFGTGISFLQQTYNRFAKIIPNENILVVTSSQYEGLVKEQLPQMLQENILLEPHRRNTAPCIAYATYKLQKKDPNATVVVAPSDHLIINEDVFLGTVESALEHASANDELLTLGIKPIRPETGYGYIQVNTAQTKEIGGSKVYSVKTFTEKPEYEFAKIFMESGEFYWNSGLYIWNVQTIIDTMSKHLPDMMKMLDDIYREIPDRAQRRKRGYEVYTSFPNASVDMSVMERADNVYVMVGEFGWADIGTWDTLYGTLPKDCDGNVFMGCNTLKYDCHNNMVSLPKGKLLVIQDIDDLVIVDEGNILMVCKRGNEKDIRKFLNDAKMKLGEKFV